MNPDTSEPSAERQAFEKWAKNSYALVMIEGLPHVYPPGSYADSRTHAAWQGWQARAGAKESQPVAWYSAKVDDCITDAKKRSRAKVQPWDAEHYDQPLYTHSRAEAPVGPARCSACGEPLPKGGCDPANKKCAAQEKSVQPADERQAFPNDNLLADLTEMAQEWADHYAEAFKGFRPRTHAYYAAVLAQARAAIAPSKEQ